MISRSSVVERRRPHRTFRIQRAAGALAVLFGLIAVGLVGVEPAASQPTTPYFASPQNNATVSGSVGIDAVDPGATSVTFYYAPPPSNCSQLLYVFCELGTAKQTTVGWSLFWNTTTVPNGSYVLLLVDSSGSDETTNVTVDNPTPTTSVLVPSNNATISGTTNLDVSASPYSTTPSPSGVSSVSFELGTRGSGGTLLNPTLIGSVTAPPSNYGWATSWNSTNAADGIYLLESVASYPNGVQTWSAPITITVNNPPITYEPTDFATVSGTAVTLDLSVPPGTLLAGFFLTGTGVDDTLLAHTGGPYGTWDLTWNSKTVPDGNYGLQCAAYNGTTTFLGLDIAITVDN